LSFETGIFPNTLKLTKFVSIPKKKGPIGLNDLRPIALTSVFSKIFERALFDRLYCFLTQNMLIDSSQHAYRKKRSIGTALIDL